MAIDRIANPAAAAAYANTAKSAASGGVGSDMPSFLSELKDASQRGIDTLRNAERVGLQGLAGKASATDVVMATTEAETTLQTIVGIRDRLIQAYQDIMRMPI